MNNLVKLRTMRGLSQKKLADLANTSQSQIDRLEKNQRHLNAEWSIRLALHLGVKARQILDPVEVEMMEKIVAGEL